MISRLKKRWTDWRRRRREESLAETDSLELREFIYLDEVGVVSLLSSRLGKLPSEFTDTLTTSSKAAVSSGVGVNIGVARSELGSNLESIQTEDTKVVSKATIQATFKRLRDHEINAGTLTVRPVRRGWRPSVNEAKSAVSEGTQHDDRWQIDPGKLQRGQLVEFEVELHAHRAYRISAIVSTFAEIAKESKEILAQVGRTDLDKIIELNKVLEKLMVGLVPLEGRLVDYRLVNDNGKERLIHRRLLEVLPEDERPESVDVHLVGVAEKSLFWKDIRRVLFAKDRFRVLCRLNGDGMTDSWTPVKLVDVLSEVAPDLSESLDFFSPEAIKDMADKSSSSRKFIEPRADALIDFGDLLAKELEVDLTDEDRQNIRRIAAQNADFLVSVPEGRKGFQEIAGYLGDRGADDLDPKIVTKLRVEACKAHELYPGGSPIYDHFSMVPAIKSRADEHYLDCEVVAIYW